MEHASNFTPVAQATGPFDRYAPRAFAVAEAAYHATNAAFWETMNARIDAARRASGAGPDERIDWPAMRAHPDVKPALAAEQEAQIAFQDAEVMLVLAEPKDWRSWVVQFQVAREHCDDLLNPLDARERKHKYTGEFPGSKLASDIVLYALGAHTGLLRHGDEEKIPPLVARLVEKRLGFNPSGRDVSPNVPGARRDVAGHGLLNLYRSALRLIGREPSPCGVTDAKSPQPAHGRLAALLTEGDAALEGEDSDEARERYSAHHQEFVDAPIVDLNDALAKLRYLKRGFTAGATEKEPEVIAQLETFLGGDPSKDLVDPTFDEIEEPAPALLAAE